MCDDYFGIYDADVSCRTLGFKRASSYSTGVEIVNRPLDPKINYLGCYGTEQTISECYFQAATTSNCYYYEHVQLYCEAGLSVFDTIEITFLPSTSIFSSDMTFAYIYVINK